MFDNLSNKLQDIFRNLRGYGKLSESNIADALREVRIALVEADVNYDVAVQFIETVKVRALGQEVLRSVTPGQQVVKVIHDELVKLLGGAQSPLQYGHALNKIMLIGLNGSGKTTTAGKLAKWLAAQGRQPLLAACDVYRPAAVDQLQTLGAALKTPVFSKLGEMDVCAIAKQALQFADLQQRNVVIFDTAGRFQIDEPLMEELVRLKAATQPQEILLVADAATGQEAANVAKAFDSRLGLTGFILTKMDGDARGGAALSIHSVTRKPVKFVGVGEKLEDLEPFHPDRLASRILGMGDIVSLVEKAEETMDEEKAKALEKKMRANDFSLQDFLEQLAMIKRMGPLENLLAMIPGIGNVKNLAVSDKDLVRIEAIIQSMTIKERRHPEILNGRRRLRIAKGSGTTVTEVNDLLKRFGTMRKMMKNMGNLSKMMGRLGGMGGMARMPGMGMMPPMGRFR
ncbi:MAG: signal recognition particle protein [Verrucomicrobiae bacterium]|nr:signal recognition particle protein [Verrucomicrobiae bacterium]